MDDKIKIVAAILDTEQLTLYREDGRQIQIKQGDPRIQPIINDVTTPLTENGFVFLDIKSYDPGTNDYREVEKQASGGLRFLRVLKNAAAKLFGGESTHTTDKWREGELNAAPVPSVSLGTVPGTKENIARIEKATTEIMAQAKPVADKDFSHSDTTEEHTMIAAVKDPKTGKETLVPGVENLEPHLRHAAKLGSSVGIQAFLARISKVINDRGHTIDELLRFMSRGDLPIANDGSIIAYKVLQSTSDKGVFVDCHSKKVYQRVGSYVHQKYVDPSRRTECSSGLHIARRGYLSGFSGDIIVLVKIAPEDVIAVPTGEPNKMRAAGYHILAEIPKDEHQRLRNDQPVDGMEAKKLLGQAVKGEHIGITERVEIGGPKGTDTVATPQIGKDAPVQKAQPKITNKTEAAEPINTDLDSKTAPAVDAKAVSEKVAEIKTAPAPKPESRSERTKRLLGVIDSNAKLAERNQAATELLDLKKASKQSWSALGVSPVLVTVIEQLATGQKPEAAPVVQVVPKAPEPVSKPVTKTVGKPSKGKLAKTAAKPIKPAPTPAPKPAKPVKKAVTKTAFKAAPKAPAKALDPVVPVISQDDIWATIKDMNRNQKGKHLLGLIEDSSNSFETRKNAYKVLLIVKKAAKVGWMQLGVNNFEKIQAVFEGV